MSQPRTASSTAALTLGAIGVVYGDIGTSPLYALKQVFAHGPRAADPGERLRRAVAVLLDADGRRLDQVRRADPARRQQRRRRLDRDARAGLAGGAATGQRCAAAPAVVGIFGTAIFFGDGVITPAISVLVARSRAWRSQRRHCTPGSCRSRSSSSPALFAFQRHGTERVGRCSAR